MTTPEKLRRELAAWERLVAAYRDKIAAHYDPAMTLSWHQKEYAYQLEALAFRLSPLDRVTLARHILSTTYSKNAFLTLLSELNDEELRLLAPDFLKLILKGGVDSAAGMFGVIKEILISFGKDQLETLIPTAFKDYILYCKEEKYRKISTSIVDAIDGLFAIDLPMNREVLGDIVREEVGESEVRTMDRYIQSLYDNPDEAMRFSDPRHT